MGANDVQLIEANFSQICRLCLQEDDEFSISVFDRIDPNPNKQPLVDRIYDLYQVQVSCRSHCVAIAYFSQHF